MSSISTLWFSAENIQHASHRSPWKGIVHVLPSFIPFTKLSLGNGSSIRFGWTLGVAPPPLPLDFLVFSIFRCFKKALSPVSFPILLIGVSTFVENS